MVERLIRPTQGTWDDVPDRSKEIIEWQQETGLKLPRNYLYFMTAYNGGRPYPLILDYSIPVERYPSTEPKTFIDILNDWDEVMEAWHGRVYGEGPPPRSIIIAQDPGGLQIVMSLDENDHGVVSSWYHMTTPWGTPPNTEVWREAGSFREFIGRLYEDEARSGLKYWHRPRKADLQRPLTV